MENNKDVSVNKNVWIWGAVVLVIVFGIIFFATKPKNDNESVLVEDNNAENTEIPNIEKEEQSNTETNVAVNPVVTLSYQQALEKYKDARIQLDKTCQASPDKMTFKNGTSIMIDNRAPVSRTIKIGSVFEIKAYDFKIIKLESSVIPATWYVDCDGSQNVSTILIQK